jgi:hypothetical protein
MRRKVRKYQPLDYDEIYKFIVSLNKMQSDLIELLNAMTDLSTRETSQEKSSPPISDQHQP